MRKSIRLGSTNDTVTNPVVVKPQKTTVSCPGTIILVDHVPVNEATVFYQCRASAMSMTYENGMVYNNDSTTTYAYQPHGSGELMRGIQHPSRVSILGKPREAVWHVLAGDGILIRDSKPDPTQTVDTLLGSVLFNNQFQAHYAGTNTLSEIRQGDIFVLFSEDVLSTFSNVRDGNTPTLMARALIFVNEGPGHVRKLLRDRDIMVGFRTRFERFVINLAASSTGGDVLPYVIIGSVHLNKTKNDTDLKKIRMRVFIMVLHKRYPFPIRFDTDTVRAIVNRL